MISTLTGIVDTDMVIISNLDDRSLLSLCSVDQYTNSLCKDEKFWEYRTRNKYSKCFLKDIKINDTNTFKAKVTCPIERGECGHIYHSKCIASWRKKRDLCPLDNRQWIPLEMDSYVTGIVDNK